MLKGEEDAPRWLIWLYTQDSEAEVWNDENSWQKSNPMIGVVKKKSDLRDLVDKARKSGAQRAFTLAKEFNIKQLSSNAWLEENISFATQRLIYPPFKIVGVSVALTLRKQTIFALAPFCLCDRTTP